jgi:hypothetical protein
MSVIPATWEVEIRRTAVWGQPGQKITKLPSQQKSQTWWHAPVIPTVWEAQVGGLPYKVGPDKKETLSEK